MKFVTKILLLLFAAMLFAVPSFAQTGNIEGTVLDTDGKPLVGATISIDRQGITQHFEEGCRGKGEAGSREGFL